MPVGVYKRTKEHGRKIGKALKNRKLSKEHKENISKFHSKLLVEKHGSWKDGKRWFEIKLRRYIRMRDGNICQNPYCESGNPRKNCIGLDTHHVKKDDDSFWMRITLCHICHVKVEGNWKTDNNINLDYWNTVFSQVLKKKTQIAEQYIKKNKKLPPELEEIMNDTEFLEHYKLQNLSPIFEESIMKKFISIKSL